jgi:hypothetical protein
VTVGGSYQNCQQLSWAYNSCGTATVGSDAFNAANPQITVIVPATANSMQGGAQINVGSPYTPAGTYGNATHASYGVGMKYNKGGTNPQGQIQLILERADGVYFITSNSISSMTFSTAGAGGGACPAKDVTIYTKASIYRVSAGLLTSIDGNVTLRLDAHDGGVSATGCTPSPSQDSIGFTVLSTKNSSLYYSNNWAVGSSSGYQTVKEPVSTTNPSGKGVVIS